MERRRDEARRVLQARGGVVHWQPQPALEVGACKVDPGDMHLGVEKEELELHLRALLDPDAQRSLDHRAAV